MNSKKYISASIVCLLTKIVFSQPAAVYVIFYSTYKGKTGHVGIAFDNYTVWAKNTSDNKQFFDTTATNELTYYDLWPNDDYFTAGRTGKNIPAEYYKLPVSSYEPVTLNKLYYQGLPHKESYPCDGILMIKTTWTAVDGFKKMLDKMIDSNKPFNGRKYNCTDYVMEPLEKLLNQKIKCKEYVGVGWSSTPNKLYKKLRKNKNIRVLKNADDKSKGSFLGQRVFYKLFHKVPEQQ
jgi:hypothetical protein